MSGKVVLLAADAGRVVETSVRILGCDKDWSSRLFGTGGNVLFHGLLEIDTSLWIIIDSLVVEDPITSVSSTDYKGYYKMQKTGYWQQLLFDDVFEVGMYVRDVKQGWWIVADFSLPGDLIKRKIKYNNKALVDSVVEMDLADDRKRLSGTILKGSRKIGFFRRRMADPEIRYSCV